ncbi:MAG: FecR domain-containing protein [Tannerella sp.]|jgi:hypothetical protein|nr:FecR domain-containing protein [Tannerella sp.]
MAIKDYSGYKADDLLKDDFFIHSVLQPTPESELFWENQNMESSEAEWAKFFIESVQVKSEEFSDEETDALWENIQIKNEKRRLAKSRKIKQMVILFSIAASFLLVVSITSIRFFKGTGSTTEKRIDMASITVPDANGQDIQLILSDEAVQLPITEKNAEIKYDAKGKVTVTTEKACLSNTNEPKNNGLQAFNQLIVPLGKRSKLILSDGSEVWVNAGTRVVYPAVFEGEDRTIFVEGEVFLSVVPDKKHPFIVRTNYMDVNVLGTSFNLSAYKDDNCFSVVLVTGSVSANKTGQREEFKIIPGERLTYSEQSVLITEVNTYNYTSWKDGVFYFQSENMGVILKRLSRYYGKEIVCDEKTALHKCSGKLDLIDELQEILNGFTHALPIRIEERDNAFYVWEVLK